MKLFSLLLVLMHGQMAIANGMDLLLPGFSSLPEKQQETLLPQLQAVDLNTLVKQQRLLIEEKISSEKIEPFADFASSGSLSYKRAGKKLIAEGKVGCLIIAGGQGTRLNYQAPKGFFPVTAVKGKTLFQLFSEKILAAGKEAGRALPVAVFTSLANHQDTVRGFDEHHLFGLDPTQLDFFSQGEIPLLDKEGFLFLEDVDKIAQGADGNAASLRHFVQSGIWEKWKERGVEYVLYLHIDNPLADPFDAELVGFHHSHQPSDMVMKCIERENPLEKVGVLVKRGDKAAVVEYSEIALDERLALVDGVFKHRLANIGLYCFSLDFIRKVALEHYDDLPFHKAWKAAKRLSKEGESRMTEGPSSWKFERFIFDVLEYAQGVKALLAPRWTCFAPLKNAQGDDSLEQVQKALLTFDQKCFSQVTGTEVSQGFFELDPQFYYPTEDLLHQWKGSSLPNVSYIIP